MKPGGEGQRKKWAAWCEPIAGKDKEKPSWCEPGGEERSKQKIQQQEKVMADDDLKLKACETKNKAKEVIVESQRVEIQKKQDEITQLEAELKSLKDRFAKEVGTNEALKTRVNAAEGKSANLENEIEKAKNLKN